MNIRLRRVCAIAVVVTFGLSPLARGAEPQSDGANTIPITTLIAAVAKRSGKKFIVDPRVRGDAVVLQDNPTALSYDDLLMLMNVHGFAAVTNGDYVRVVPDAAVRQMAVPIADGDKHPLAEYVTRVWTVKSVPASQLVPLLRPLLPQQSHLVALPCTNNLIAVDTFGNTQRLDQIIKSLDRGEPYVPEKCKPGEPPLARPAGKDKGNDKDKGS
jgi:type II secretory pathway component GspD/PulD (secretin)